MKSVPIHRAILLAIVFSCWSVRSDGPSFPPVVRKIQKEIKNTQNR